MLGVDAGASIDEIVEHHRSLQRRHHPDRFGGNDRAATEYSARLNLALSVLRRSVVKTVPADPPVENDDRAATVGGDDEISTDGDTVLVAAPPDETFLRLLEAGATLGGIGHVDPRLGLLEFLVRFEGGPTCSVLLTLQGRSDHTEVWCEMESIEASPTPPLAPVVDELVSALRRTTTHPRPGGPR